MSDDNDDLLDPAEIEALLNEAGASEPTTPPPPAATPSAEAPSSDQPATSTPETDGDQMSQDDLDRLMAEATSGTASLEAKPDQPTSPPPSDDNGGDLLDPGEIEQLLKAQNPAATATEAQSPVATNPAPAAGFSADTDELLRQAEAGLAAAISSDGGTSSTPGPFGNPQPYTFQEFGKSPSGSTNAAMKTLHDVELDIRIELGRTELLIEEVLQLRDGSVVPLDKLAGDPVDVIVNERLVARGEVLVLNDNFCVRITEILPPHL